MDLGPSRLRVQPLVVLRGLIELDLDDSESGEKLQTTTEAFVCELWGEGLQPTTEASVCVSHNFPSSFHHFSDV